MRLPEVAYKTFSLLLFFSAAISVCYSQETQWRPSLRLVDEAGKDVDGKVAVLLDSAPLKPGERSFFRGLLQFEALADTAKIDGRWEPENKRSTFLVQTPNGTLETIPSFDRTDIVIEDHPPIELTFLDSDRKPVQNAKLTLLGFSDGSPLVTCLLPKPWEDRYRFTTSDQGRFRVPYMHHGIYFFYDLHLEGDRHYRYVYYLSGADSMRKPSTILPQVSRLQGKVVREQKLEGEWYARLFPADYPSESYFLPPDPIAKVNDDGTFAFEQVPSGNYSVLFVNRGKEQADYPLPIRRFLFSRETSNVQTVAAPAVKLVGRFVGPRQTLPKTDCSIVLDWRVEVQPKEDGTFELLIPPVNTTISPFGSGVISNPQSVQLAQQKPTEEVEDFTLKLDDFVVDDSRKPFQVVAGPSLLQIFKSELRHRHFLNIGDSGIELDVQGRGYFYSEQEISQAEIAHHHLGEKIDLVAKKAEGGWTIEVSQMGNPPKAFQLQIVNQLGKPVKNKSVALNVYRSDGYSSYYLNSDAKGMIQIPKLNVEEDTGELRIAATDVPLGYNSEQFATKVKVPLPFNGSPTSAKIYEIPTKEFQATILDEEGTPLQNRSGWFCQQGQFPHHFTTNDKGEFTIRGDIGKGFVFLEKSFAICPISLEDNVPARASIKDNLLQERGSSDRDNLPRSKIPMARRKEIAQYLVDNLVANSSQSYSGFAKKYGFDPFCNLDDAYALLDRIRDQEERSEAAWILTCWWKPQEEAILRKLEGYCPSHKLASMLLLEAYDNYPDPVQKRKILNDAWKHVEKDQHAGSTAILVSLHLFWLDDYDKFSVAVEKYNETMSDIEAGEYELPYYEQRLDKFIVQVIDDSGRRWQDLLKEIYKEETDFLHQDRNRGASILALLLSDREIFQGEIESPEFRKAIFRHYQSPGWCRRQVLRYMTQTAPEHTWELYLDARDRTYFGMLDVTRSELLKLDFHARDLANEILADHRSMLSVFALGNWQRRSDIAILSDIANRLPEIQTEVDWLISFFAFQPNFERYFDDSKEGFAIAQQIKALRHLHSYQPKLALALDLHPEHLIEKRVDQKVDLRVYPSQPELANEVALYCPELLPKICVDRRTSGQGSASEFAAYLSKQQASFVSVVLAQLLNPHQGP